MIAASKASRKGFLVITDKRVKHLLGTTKHIVVIDLPYEEARGLLYATPEEVVKGLDIVEEHENSLIAVEKPVIEHVLEITKKCVNGIIEIEKRKYEVRRLPLRGKAVRIFRGLEKTVKKTGEC